MTPTPKLRFLERDRYVKDGEVFRVPFKDRILQQWWEVSPGHVDGEWRDVPVEEEK